MRVLAGSIDVASVYLFYSEGTVCSIDLNVTANVSIKAGSPLGMLCMYSTCGYVRTQPSLHLNTLHALTFVYCIQNVQYDKILLSVHL